MVEWIPIDDEHESPKHLQHILVAVIVQFQDDFLTCYDVWESQVWNSSCLGFSFREPIDEDKDLLKRYENAVIIPTHWMPKPKHPFNIEGD